MLTNTLTIEGAIYCLLPFARLDLNRRFDFLYRRILRWQGCTEKFNYIGFTISSIGTDPSEVNAGISCMTHESHFT